MAKWTYDESLRRLLADEGGNDDDPRDPGGRTSRGIIQREWNQWRLKHPGLPADVWKAPQSEVKAIYREKYWDVEQCDDQWAGVDYAVFDYAVNSGVGRAGKVLRRLLNLPTNTSAITSEVLIAARKRDPKALVAAICDERLAFLRNLKTWPTFGGGWGRRVKGVKAAATVMAGKSEPSALPPEVVPAQSKGKGQIPPPNTKAITHGAPAATAAAGYGFWDSITAHPFVSIAIAAALLAAILVTLRAIKAAHTAKQETPPPNLQPVPEVKP